MFRFVTFAIHYILVIVQLVLSFVPNPTSKTTSTTKVKYDMSCTTGKYLHAE